MATELDGGGAGNELMERGHTGGSGSGHIDFSLSTVTDIISFCIPVSTKLDKLGPVPE